MYSLNYTEDDQCLGQKLIELPPMLGIDTVGSTASSHDAASTPSQTTGNTAGSQWPGSERDAESPQGQPPPAPSCPSTGTAFASAQQAQQARQHLPPSARANMPSASRLPPHLTVTTAMAPSYDPNSIFSNAFFHDTSNQNFDFLWQEWDPAVFDDIKMDIDENMDMGNLNGGNDFMPQQ
jgi:hypothetical protein